MRDAKELRTFLALELGDAARRHAAALAAALRDAPDGDDVRWVRPEALHVTLRFLGRTEPVQIPGLVREVAGRVREVAPFALRLGAARLFPSPRQARVVVLDLEPSAALTELADAVEQGVVAAGFPPETRAFRPHVSLGRARRGRRARLAQPEARESAQGVTASVTAPRDTWDVVDVVLFRSQFSPQGARYTPLERVPLGATGGPLHP